MGKAARLRGQRQRAEAEARVKGEAEREKLEEAFGTRLTDLEGAMLDNADLTIRRPGRSISGGKLDKIAVVEGPKLVLTIVVEP